MSVDACKVAKDGSKSANARTLIWPNGRTVKVGDGLGWTPRESAVKRIATTGPLMIRVGR